jgi:hypothetical protein
VADQLTCALALVNCRPALMGDAGDNPEACRIFANQGCWHMGREVMARRSLSDRTVSGGQEFEVGGTADTRMMQSATWESSAWKVHSPDPTSGGVCEVSSAVQEAVNHELLGVGRQAWKI